jgi:hypothetical protein
MASDSLAVSSLAATLQLLNQEHPSKQQNPKQATSQQLLVQ